MQGFLLIIQNSFVVRDDLLLVCRTAMTAVKAIPANINMDSNVIFDHAIPVSFNEINPLNALLEYVIGKKLLMARKFSGSISIGRAEPVVDSCITKNATAMKRPIFPANATRKNIIARNERLAMMENKTSKKPFIALNLMKNSANTLMITA